MSEERHPRTIEQFPPRDRCMVAPCVMITEHEHAIWCEGCHHEERAPSYAEAYEKWLKWCNEG